MPLRTYFVKNNYSRLTLRMKVATVLLLAFTAGALTYLLLPKPELLSYKSYSTAVFDRNNQMLRITLAQDDRYRLYTPIENIAEQFQEATILYEDQYFYEHNGVDYAALARAFWQTYVRKERRIGASTIVMQIARLRWNIPSNTLGGKVEQIMRALQLSRHYSKTELLEAYLNLAPYGGNIEGIGAASLIYFNKPASELSLSETLTLAVVPQNPSKRNPSKTTGLSAIEQAKTRLLERWLLQNPKSKPMESLISLPLAVRKSSNLPYYAPHFVQYVVSKPSTIFTKLSSDGATLLQTQLSKNMTKTLPTHKNIGASKHQHIQTTLDLNLHLRLEVVLQDYIRQRKNEGFSNASALLLNHKTMHIEAMIGSENFNNIAIQGQVNGTLAKRSPGSTLKPFVYGLALDAGLIHPMTMLKDLPKKYAGFAPENFGRGFVGPISAQDALIRSRNVPAVDLQYQLIQQQNNEKNSVQVSSAPTLNFYEFLHKAGISQLKSADFYGLALALGGGEVSMLELVELYASIANLGEHTRALSTTSTAIQTHSNKTRLLSPEAAFLVFDMLSKNPAPNAAGSLLVAPKRAQAQKTAWKTGTSWAFRDAWAIGINGDYVMAVWIGNFNGAGNNAFIGRSAAGPLLFKLFDVVEKATKSSTTKNPVNVPDVFQHTPFEQSRLQALNIKWVDICLATGDLYQQACPSKGRTLFIPGVSPIRHTNIYRSVWINETTGLRQCDNTSQDAREQVFAFWPSDFQALFEKAGVYIEKPPKFAPHCSLNNIALQGNKPIISSPQAQLHYILQDSVSHTVSIPLKASADAEASFLYWFANGQYIASENISQSNIGRPLLWQATPGEYIVLVSDDLGRSASVAVSVQAME